MSKSDEPKPIHCRCSKCGAKMIIANVRWAKCSTADERAIINTAREAVSAIRKEESMLMDMAAREGKTLVRTKAWELVDKLEATLAKLA